MIDHVVNSRVTEFAKAKGQTRLQANLSKIASTRVVVEQEKATGRLQCVVIEKIISYVTDSYDLLDG